MFNSLRKLLQRFFGGTPEVVASPTDIFVEAEQVSNAVDTEVQSSAGIHHSIPYNESLMEQARAQWQFGEWESLIGLDLATLEPNPDRAKLALIVATAWQQLNDHAMARVFVRLALEWGCDRKLVARLLVAGVHNTLGRVVAINRDGRGALEHFRQSVSAVSGNKSFASHSRALKELKRIGLVTGLTTTATTLTVEKGELSVVAQASKNASNDHKKNEGAQTEAVIAPPDKVVKLVDDCMAAADVLERIDQTLDKSRLTKEESFFFFVELSDRFRSQKDNLTALNFLNEARKRLDPDNESLRNLLARKFIALGKADQATDIIVQSSLTEISETQLTQDEKKALKQSYEKVRQLQSAKAEHGHEVLLAYLRQHLPELSKPSDEKKLTLIEIGTTRENVPGQGSTQKIADFCKAKGLHFITVDMDPHNTRVAADMFAKMEVPFEAVAMKGEDYLRDYPGKFDFIFLDAYDFDHGKHSDLRQSRYEKFLGAKIDDAECNKMHLDCAKSVVDKLTPRGVVCMDDTWIEDGRWTAKGTLAMPYLLDQGFQLLEARNRAALLCRPKEVNADV